MLNEELDVAIDELAKVQATRGHQGLINYIEELRTKKSILVEKKGKRLAEKLGTKWYNEGEKSNRYFMRLLNRANPDKFTKLEGSNGEGLSNELEIEREIVRYYKNLYENFDETIVENNDDNFFQGIDPIEEDEVRTMCEDISEDELRTTLLSCRDSAPGPDGIPYSIIGLVWSTFGPALTAAWRHSLAIKSLAPSHKVSYLKLIPKIGKNLDKLTNWRPITLSNCDHKLITKTYARRLSEKLATKLGERQTAYLKGRLINDNLRAMLATVEVANNENLEGLIVALDAKKAFDSVSHSYIESCLEKFGCKDFIHVFKTLYSELRTDILINGRIVKGYMIRRGVKQGDALSCILFIICMEPLLSNIESNQAIKPLRSNHMGTDLPKTFAYADDVSATVNDDDETIENLFREYERLTKMSGLELNAEKTELMRIGRDPPARDYNVTYRNESYQVRSSDSIKLNGIIFHRDRKEVARRNVRAAVNKMDQHFKHWMKRSLSTLGKILIAKTFGISQIVYLMQTIKLDECDYKLINATLYKFIWNRHYLAAKAPERVKREIVNKPIKYGGFGMLDIAELDASLKIKALGRFLNSRHPFLKLIRNKLDLSNFFEPQLKTEIEGVLEAGTKLLRQDRDRIWEIKELDRNRNIMNLIRNIRISELLNRLGKSSIAFFMINRREKKVKDLCNQDLNQLTRFICGKKIDKLRLAINLNIRKEIDNGTNESYLLNGLSKPLVKCSSKEIRIARSNRNPITNYKAGLILDTSTALTWGMRLNKLTSTKHKLNLLKAAHGEVYTKVELYKYGMTANDKCPRCDETETLDHKLYTCVYTERI